MPEGIPILRIVDPLMAQRMAMWVMWGVINHQRKMDQYWEVRTAQAGGRLKCINILFQFQSFYAQLQGWTSHSVS